MSGVYKLWSRGFGTMITHHPIEIDTAAFLISRNAFTSTKHVRNLDAERLGSLLGNFYGIPYYLDREDSRLAIYYLLDNINTIKTYDKYLFEIQVVFEAYQLLRQGKDVASYLNNITVIDRADFQYSLIAISIMS